MSYTVNRQLLHEGDVCHRCGKDLRTVGEIHVSEGMHFCSEECAVNHYVDDIILNAREGAKALYRDLAEVVTPVDIGLVYEDIWTIHTGDITVIFKSAYKDESQEDLISTEVVGFYYGEPNYESTQEFIGKLKVTY